MFWKGKEIKREKERNRAGEKKREGKSDRRLRGLFSRQASISSSAVSFYREGLAFGVCFGRLAVALVLFLHRLNFVAFSALLLNCLSASRGDHHSKLTIIYVLEKGWNAPRSVILAAISYRFYRAAVV